MVCKRGCMVESMIIIFVVFLIVVMLKDLIDRM